jgi:hypothetical protein
MYPSILRNIFYLLISCLFFIVTHAERWLYIFHVGVKLRHPVAAVAVPQYHPLEGVPASYPIKNHNHNPLLLRINKLTREKGLEHPRSRHRPHQPIIRQDAANVPILPRPQLRLPRRAQSVLRNGGNCSHSQLRPRHCRRRRRRE